MRKIFFLVLFVSCAFLAQAGAPYYVGLNQLRGLFDAIEEPILDKSDPPAPVTNLFMPNADDGNGIEDGAYLSTENDNGWGKIGGLTWTESVKIADFTEDDGAPSGTDYYAIKSLDWSPAIYSYTQKSDVNIVLEQPAYEIYEEAAALTTPAEGLTLQNTRKTFRSFLQRRELRFLTSLNLAGNQFRNITINGNDLMELESIDLSNNPTLTYLELKNLPMLATLDITGSPSVILVVENCPDLVVTGTPATGISNHAVETPTCTAVYTIDGRLVSKGATPTTNGLYILRLSDGTAQKVLVK
jgi:hypothetical protein